MTRPLCALVASLTLPPTFAAGQVETVVLPPQTPVQPGQATILTVFFHNPGDTNAEFTLPANIEANWLQRGRRYAATLEAMGAGRAATTIAPRTHIERRYTARVPQQVGSGPLKLRLTTRSAPALVLIAKAAPDARQPALANTPQNTKLIRPAETDEDETRTRNSFLDNIFAHQPLYFLAGLDPTNAKFQISFKYRFIDADSEMAQDNAWLQGFFLAYTQTSFWDLSAESIPFEDTNFKPEVFYQFRDVEWPALGASVHTDLRLGLQHKSNGRGGSASRSLNLLYLEPAVHWRLSDTMRLSLAPRVWDYTGDLSDNPDIKRFRGRSSLTATLSQRDGWQLEAYLRGNPSTGKGAARIDLTYPLNRITFSNIDFYLHGQFFTGYGENLLNFDTRDTRFRLGLSIVR